MINSPNQNDSILNHNHEEEHKKVNGLNSKNDLTDAQKQISSLQDNLNQTMGKSILSQSFL